MACSQSTELSRIPAEISDAPSDLLLEVETALGLTDAFTHLRAGVPCGDRIGLLNVLLAQGLNLGLRKMAEASNTHDYAQLSRLARWHVESEAIDRALANVVAAQGDLPWRGYGVWARLHPPMVSSSPPPARAP